MTKPVVSIIYVYYNTPDEIIRSIASIPNAVEKFTYEIIIINNLSPRPVPNQLTKIKYIQIINNNENKGYGGALNQGAKIAKGKYLLLVNPDTIFLKSSIRDLITKISQDSNIGIIGPQFLDQDKNVSITGTGIPILPDAMFALSVLHKIFPRNFYSNRFNLSQFDRYKESEIPVICGACMLMKKSFFEEIHGFDEQFFMYFEESDLCYRIKKAGKNILYYPKAKVIHLGGRSSNDKLWIRKVFEESRYKFFKKYHNPIIAFSGEAFLRISNNILKYI